MGFVVIEPLLLLGCQVRANLLVHRLFDRAHARKCLVEDGVHLRPVLREDRVDFRALGRGEIDPAQRRRTWWAKRRSTQSVERHPRGESRAKDKKKHDGGQKTDARRCRCRAH
jgi:hypothetical protein